MLYSRTSLPSPHESGVEKDIYSFVSTLGELVATPLRKGSLRSDRISKYHRGSFQTSIRDMAKRQISPRRHIRKTVHQEDSG